MVKLCFIFLCSLCVATCFSQDNLSFVTGKLRADYFPLGVEVDTVQFNRNIEKARTIRDTFESLSSVIVPFNDPHLILIQPRINTNADSNRILNRQTTEAIHARVKANTANKMAGYWINDRLDCVVAIIPATSKDMYEGYAVECKNDFYKGARILSLSNNAKNPTVQFIDWEENYRQTAALQFPGADQFQVGHYSRWKKIDHYNFPYLQPEQAASYTASARLLDSSTILFTIPAHSGDNISIVDSLVNEYKDFLSRARLLVIDIRNNPGGTPRVHLKLIPYIYTNTIVRGQGYTYITTDLINYEKRTLKAIDSVNDRDSYTKQAAYIDSLEQKKGTHKLVVGKIVTQDSVSTYPLKVAVLANYACMSAAEVMLLDFRQSKKVKIFGEPTAGATDNLDYFPITTPGNNYLLFMPSLRIKPTKTYGHYAKTGIVPDIIIPPGQTNWIKFVTDYFEKQ